MKLPSGVNLSQGRDNDPALVRRLQRELIELGHGPLRGRNRGVDGSFGPSTDAAVRQFQNHERRLDIDGVVDEPTAQAMEAALQDHRRCICGPSVDDWFLEEIKLHASAMAAHSQRFRNKLTKPGGPSTPALFKDYVKSLQRYGAYLNYKKMAFEVEGCPKAEVCKNTVYLCGLCVDRSELGNIMLGYIMQSVFRDFGFILESSIYAGVANVAGVGRGGGVDSAADAGGLALGANLAVQTEYKNPRRTKLTKAQFCKALRANHSFDVDAAMKGVDGKLKWIIGPEKKYEVPRKEILAEIRKGLSDPGKAVHKKGCEPCKKPYKGPHTDPGAFLAGKKDKVMPE